MLTLLGSPVPIGIERPPNAVGDARGVLALFTRLGFERVGPLLLDEHATGDAIVGETSDGALIERYAGPAARGKP